MVPTHTNRFSSAVATWLLVEGVWGLFSSEIFGLLTTNRLHATIHLVLGIWGLRAAFTRGARAFLWVLGVILVAVGVAYFVPAGRELTDIIAVNRPVAILNLILGGLSLTCAAKCGDEVVRLHRSSGKPRTASR